MRISAHFTVVALSGACLALGGCIDIFARHSTSFSSAASEPEEETDAGSRSADERPGFAHSGRRVFPQQGWWCHDYAEWLSPERVEHGYTIVLPGVEGTSCHNIAIARGLVDGGHESAIELRDWTTGYSPLFAYHLMALNRNRKQAQEIADQIVAYQDAFPDRPVRLVGHSGGAAMAVFVLEALPEDRKVTQVVLLAAALSREYDLSKALARCERGIVNFYSWGDVPHLVVGTAALGTIDRKHTISAGAGGFRVPKQVGEAGRELYAERLQQIPYRPAMLKSRNAGGHIGPTTRKFVSEWVAPLF